MQLTNQGIPGFLSTFKPINLGEEISFPTFSGLRIMMMPVTLGSLSGIPQRYHDLCRTLYQCIELRHVGYTGYLTIDERRVSRGMSHRRPGLHVDGYYHGSAGGWGGGGTWGSVGNGMLTVSSHKLCQVFPGFFEGEPGPEGECDHLDVIDKPSVWLEPRKVYWLDGACVHRSAETFVPIDRSFVRLSLPSDGPWFEGYTPNPEGILPSGRTLPARTEFMSSRS